MSIMHICESETQPPSNPTKKEEVLREQCDEFVHCCIHCSTQLFRM